MAEVVALYTYPVKGCAAVEVSEVGFTAAGPAHDRTFLVVGEGGLFRSQRRDPRLALIRPEVAPDGSVLTLAAPGMPEIRLDVDLSAPRTDVEMFRQPYRGIDQGDDVAAWLSAFLDVPARLVRVPPEHDRVTTGLVPGTAAYADGAAVLAASTASLDELNRRIEAGGGRALPMSRFRPNIVIGGWDRAHREDELREVEIGGVGLAYTKLAIRCAVTLVDQDTGAKAGLEPLRTMAAYRRAKEGGTAFGAKFSVVRPGTMTVGDKVVAGSWGESEV